MSFDETFSVSFLTWIESQLEIKKRRNFQKNQLRRTLIDALKTDTEWSKEIDPLHKKSSVSYCLYFQWKNFWLLNDQLMQISS